MGGVRFINGAAAIAAGASTTYFTAEGYGVDTSKHALTLLDRLTPAEIREIADYLGVLIDQGEDPDTKQVLVRAIETSLSEKYLATVVAASGLGNVVASAIEVTVTSTLLTGGAKAITVNVPVTANTVALVAAAIRAALAADEDIAAHYAVTGAAANIILTATADPPVANDATLAIAITDADGSTITMGGSQNTTPGVAGTTAQVETATVTATAAVTHAAITITGAGSYRYKIGDAAFTPIYGDDVSDWTVCVSGVQIPIAQAGKTITVARVTTGNKVTGIGSVVIAI
jgi:hypothetical protein